MSKFKAGNYKLGKLLGMGTFGVVRLGTNEITKHEVAVKILSKKKVKHQKMMDKVKREIHISKMLNHPHVGKLFEYFDINDEIYIVFEYIPNGELYELIRKSGPIDPTLARKYFQQIVYAIQYVHSFGISHRDLKPENILIDDDGNIKIIDFGLSNMFKDGRALKTFCGSRNYASPEIIEGKDYDGTQSDIWSLGVILYAMLYGEMPFDDENNTTLCKSIREAKYYMKGYQTIEAKDLLNRMLQPNPLKRISIEEIIEHPWFNKNSVSKYLLDPFLGYTNYKFFLDDKIISQLFKLKLGLKEDQLDQIKTWIQNGYSYDFCIAYEYLAHYKTLNKLHEESSLKPRSPAFEKPKLKPKQVKLVTSSNQKLVTFKERPKIIEFDLGAKKSHLAKPRKSIQTDFTSGDIGCPWCLKNEMSCTIHNKNWVGLVFQAKLPDLINAVFTVLRENKIVWKSWNSEFVYKCETGVPWKDPKVVINNDKLNDLVEEDLLKFFVNFSSIPKPKQAFDYDINAKQDVEYLVSFIWIKGKTLKFLDFISNFKLSISEIL